jgi:hypothetical protein
MPLIKEWRKMATDYLKDYQHLEGLEIPVPLSGFARRPWKAGEEGVTG